MLYYYMAVKDAKAHLIFFTGTQYSSSPFSKFSLHLLNEIPDGLIFLMHKYIYETKKETVFTVDKVLLKGKGTATEE